MEYRDHPELRIVWLDDPTLDLRELAKGVCDIVHFNPELRRDFPKLPGWYESWGQALLTLQERVTSMKLCFGAYRVGAVYYGAQLIGMATISQNELRMRRSGSRRKVLVANGPWLACWLDTRRPPEQRLVGRSLLRLIAADIIANPVMHDTPFTVVLPGNKGSRAMLEDTANGFGGFTPLESPQIYPVSDGVDVPRLLYVARHTVEELRA